MCACFNLFSGGDDVWMGCVFVRACLSGWVLQRKEHSVGTSVFHDTNW